MKNQIYFLLVASCLLFQLVATPGCQKVSGENSLTSSPAKNVSLNSRAFEFKYGATITQVPENAKVQVWFPIAESNAQQQVSLINSSTPTEMQLHRDETYGNQIGFFELKMTGDKDLKFELTFDVDRVEAMVDGTATKLTDDQKKLFLSANSLVPVDGKPQELLHDKDVPAESVAAGKVLYDVVEQHMSYDKSQPGYGNGDAVWACDSRTGNCTDFHSLFISLARSQKIPARFEIGFPLPNDKTEGEIGGYHCWAWFHADEKGWSPVDISEADKHPEMKDYYFGKLTADRVSFSTGRDIELTPKSVGGPLNYFVYPYLEVDGKPWPKEKIKLNFSFKDKK